MTQQTPVERANAQFRAMIPRYHAMRRRRSPIRPNPQILATLNEEQTQQYLDHIAAQNAGGPTPLTQEEYQQYLFFRGHRSTTKLWRRRNKAKVAARVRASLAESKAWLETARSYRDWLISVTPNEDHYREVHGLAAGEELGTYSIDVGGGATATASHAQAFSGVVRLHQGHVDNMNDYIEEVEDELLVVEDVSNVSDDDIIDFVAQEVIAHFLSVGLEPHAAWNERDDGCIWFTNPETGLDHCWSFKSMISLRRVNYDMSAEMVETSYADRVNWQAKPYFDLGRIGRFGGSNLRTIARDTHDYFGAWDGLLPYIRTIIGDSPSMTPPANVSVRGF